MIILAQAETIATKALDTITSAIQGGLVGVAIILAAAVIILAIVVALAIRSGNSNVLELLKFNGRLAASLEKMDTTLDKMSEQQGQIGKLFAELTATLRDIPKGSAATLEQITLIRNDLIAYTKSTDSIVAGVQKEMRDLATGIERRLGDITGKLQKIKPDTKPIPALPDVPVGLPEVPALSTNNTENGET